MDTKIPGADGVRALACLMVLGHHLAQRLKPFEMGQTVMAWDFLLWAMGSGVAVFFVLSGMLLARPFWQAWLERRAMPALWPYALRRLARIAPAFYVALVVSFALQLWLLPEAQAPWLRFFAALSFTSGFHWLSWFPVELNGPLWSISLEVFCYLVLPLFMLPLFALLRGRSVGIGLLWWAMGLALVLALNAWVLAHFSTPQEGRGWQYGLIGGAKTWLPNYNPVGMFAQFLFGVLAAAGIAYLPRMRGLAGLRAYGVFDGLGILALLGGLALHIKWVMVSAELKDFPGYILSIQQQPYFFPSFAALCALLLVAAAASRWLGALLDNRLFRWLAQISFGLYLWHFALIELCHRLWVPDYQVFGISSLSRWAYLSLGVIAASLVAAQLSYRYIEKPVLDAVKRWERRRHPAPGLAQQAA